MRNLFLLGLIATLAACGQQPRTVDNAANGAAASAEIDVLPPDDTVAPPEGDLTTEVASGPARPAGESEAPTLSIPAALHGRWGLVPGDCTSTRGDAKGLVTIGEDSIRFYESRARPVTLRSRSDRAIEGDFAFTGEGQEWTTTMSWSVAGDTLTRVDSTGNSKLVYKRCVG